MKEQRSSQRPLLLTAGGIFLVAACIGGSYFWLQNRAANHARNVGLQRSAETFARMNQAAKSTPQQKARKIAHARMLRGKWQVWAQRNQGLLKKMLQAQPGDQNALNAVRNALPPAGDQSIVTAKDLMPDGESPTGLVFGWASIDRMMETGAFKPIDNPEQRREVQQAITQMSAARQNDFETLRDVVLSSSSGQGNTQVTLWVSGRITQRAPQSQEERMAAVEKARASGREARASDLQNAYREVAPPFDFLK